MVLSVLAPAGAVLVFGQIPTLGPSCSSFVHVGLSRASCSILDSVFPFSCGGTSLLESLRTIT